MINCRPVVIAGVRKGVIFVYRFPVVRKDLQMREDYSYFTRPLEFRIQGRGKHLYWCYSVDSSSAGERG